ncbi:MAG TPA: DUF2948 family protein [Thermohalobaculum sp.]|nr:DUF2948 family protein [Thermohalobaculum sp.]
MGADARFEDAPFADRPLRLRAEDADDLVILSSLMQDAVVRTGDIRWLGRRRRLVILANRFRWEDAEEARRRRRPFERVRTALTVEGVLGLKAQRLDPARPDAVTAVLALGWQETAEGAGRLTVSLAEGAAIVAEVEMLDVTLVDLTRPWEARSGAMPSHEG